MQGVEVRLQEVLYAGIVLLDDEPDFVVDLDGGRLGVVLLVRHVTPEEEIKQPLVLEFLGLKDEYSETELEDALIVRDIRTAVRLWYNPGLSSKKFYGPGIFVLALSMFPQISIVSPTPATMASPTK